MTVQCFHAADDPASKPRYKNSSEAYRRILAEEGLIGGLYRGYFPNLIRNSIISATELVRTSPQTRWPSTGCGSASAAGGVAIAVPEWLAGPVEHALDFCESDTFSRWKLFK